MKIRSSFAAVFVLLASSALAAVPESGLWWNPDEPGRGYTIELQDDLLFAAFYAYQEDGRQSAFYTATVELDGPSGKAQGPLYAARNGQCFGCSHRVPDIDAIGTVRFEFDSPVTGEITMPGGLVIPVERMTLPVPHWTDPAAMLGIWSIVDGDRLFFGEQLWFRELTDAVDDGFLGHRVGSNSRLALGQPTNDPDLPAMIVLLDSSTSYYVAYAFDNSVERWIGRSWTYRKDEQLSGPGVTSVAYRFLGNNMAQQALGIASKSGEGALASESEAALAQRDAQRRRLTLGDGEAAAKVVGGHVKIGEHSYDLERLKQAFAELAEQDNTR